MTDLPDLVVATGDPTPPYEQLRRQLAAMVADGVLRPGTRLPPLRQLAGDLGLAVGTVARAYRELENAGLIVSRRGGGTRVTDHLATPPPAPRQRAQVPVAGAGALQRAAADFVQYARQLDVPPAAILAAVQGELEDPGGLR